MDINIFVGVDKDFCRDCLMRCLDILGQELKRWRSLSFYVMPSAMVNMSPILSDNLSYLRSVGIPSHSSNPVAALASCAPLLNTFEFAGLVPYDINPYIDSLTWPRIREITYDWGLPNSRVSARFSLHA